MTINYDHVGLRVKLSESGALRRPISQESARSKPFHLSTNIRNQIISDSQPYLCSVPVLSLSSTAASNQTL